MEGLRLELCQRAAKSFLREELGKLDSLGTMGAFTLGQNGRTRAYMEGRDLSAKHLLHWLKADSKETRTKIYQATIISNSFNHPHDDHFWRVPFHHSANLFNMPQTGMFRKEDGTLRIPTRNSTLAGTPLTPEGDPEDMIDPPLIATPWSENETQLMFQLFPRIDSLCLNFSRTGVFQWNEPDSSTLIATTQWPQRIAGDLPRRLNQGGIESTRMDPQPRMPYVIFRHMGPHFDSYANSGIPDIKGTEHQFYRGEEGEKRLELLHLLPHLHFSVVGTDVTSRIEDLQQLAKAIKNSTG